MIAIVVLTSVVTGILVDQAVRGRAAFSRRAAQVIAGSVVGGAMGFISATWTAIGWTMLLMSGCGLVIEAWFRRLRVLLSADDRWPSVLRRSSQFGVAAYKRSLSEVIARPGFQGEPYDIEQMWGELARYVSSGVMVKDRERRNVASIDARGELFNVAEGRRCTTGHPTGEVPSVICLGGSTMFCYEVPDQWTVPSRIQAALNDLRIPARVENYGLGGATLSDRVRVLESIAIGNGDVVVVLFGVNEVGINAPQRLRLRGKFKRLRLVPKMLYGMAGVSVALDWYAQRVLEWEYSDLKFDDRVVEHITHDLERVDQIATRAGATVVAALQPNLYTKSIWSADEWQLASKYPAHWGDVVRQGYASMRRSIPTTDGRVHDISDVMNDEIPSPYLDWAHVNSRGNDRLARALTAHIVPALNGRHSRDGTVKP